ncbi:MAG: type II secretion system protein GspE, partial [Candidatus Omnitrophica bacterium]|nr:type II secretion system protein GspE [Candidatus Omnitrophota bacterium]
VSPEITDTIPAKLARQYLLVPIDKIGNNLTLAMSNPLNTQAVSDVELLSGCSVQAFVSTSSDIKKAIDKYYKDKQ